MKKLIIVLMVALFIFSACDNRPTPIESESSPATIEGSWKSDNGDEFYINSTDLFQAGYAIPYKIKNDKELILTDANGNEQIVEYSLKDDILTLKFGKQGIVYHRQD